MAIQYHDKHRTEAYGLRFRECQAIHARLTGKVNLANRHATMAETANDKVLAHFDFDFDFTTEQPQASPDQGDRKPTEAV